MATQKIWVWKHLFYPCLGSYLSNLGSFLTCPEPPCQCSCCVPREQQTAGAAGIKQLPLSCHGFWPSLPGRVRVSLPHTQSQQSCDIVSKAAHKGELPQLGRLRADWHARLWGRKDTKHGLDCKWTHRLHHLTVTGYADHHRLWDLSQRLQFRNRFAL